MKSRLRPLPPLMSTRVNCEPTTTGSRTSRNFPGSEKLVHWASQEKEIGTSLYLRGFYMASLTKRISRRVSFCTLLEEAAVSAEDDVDNILRVLKVLSPRLVNLVVVPLILLLSVLRSEWKVE
jgi:ABC-type uncharacterized transport system involved in gliding motility auxiliary subunit